MPTPQLRCTVRKPTTARPVAGFNSLDVSPPRLRPVGSSPAEEPAKIKILIKKLQYDFIQYF